MSLLVTAAVLMSWSAAFAQGPTVPQSELFLRLGHAGSISAMAFSSDGKMMASGALDNAVKLWDARTGELLMTLKGHQSGATALAFSPDSAVLASGARDQTIRLWDVHTGELRTTLSGHGTGSTVLSFAPDGKTLAAGTDESKAVRLWDVRTGKLLNSLNMTPKGFHDEHPGLLALTFSPGGKKLLAADRQTMRSWDFAAKAAGKPNPIVSVPARNRWTQAAFSTDGSLATAAMWESEIKLHEVRTGRLRQTFATPKANELRAVIFSLDGKTLATGGGNNPVRLWDALTGKLRRVFANPRMYVTSLALTPDGKTLAVGNARFFIELWDIEKETPRDVLPGSGIEAASVALSPDGGTLASGHLFDETVRLWDMRTGRLQRTILAKTANVSRLIFFPDNRLLAVGSGPYAEKPGTIRIWDSQSGALVRTLADPGGVIYDFALSPDGKTLASGNSNGTTKIWNTRSSKLIRMMPGPAAGVVCISFSPDGKLLASGCGDGTVRLWNAQTGRMTHQFGQPHTQVDAVVFSTDGLTLSASSTADDGRACPTYQWNVKTGRLQGVLRGEVSPLLTVFRAPPDATDKCLDTPLVIEHADNDSTISVSCGDTLIQRLEDAAEVALSRDGKWLFGLSAALDRVKIWDASSGHLRTTFLLLPPENDADTSQEWIAYTPDGYYDGSPGADNFIRWKTGKELYPVAKYEKQFHRPDLLQKALRSVRAEEEVDR